MPLNLNTYGDKNQIITSSPLSQKLKENHPQHKMIKNRLDHPEFLYDSTLSPITTSTCCSSTSSSSSSINSLVKSSTTMSNDELFTAIYKSKRKLNIKNDNEIAAGTIDDSLIRISNNVPDNNKIGTRHSWSPESQSSIKLQPSCINEEVNLFIYI